MCIAIVSEVGVELPKKKILKRCFENNPDGAGYAVMLPTEKWEGKKGFMTWKSFWKAFNKEQYSKDDMVLIHFRIGTSGKKEHPDCTHPFPVTDNEADLILHHFVSDSIIMHNGTCGQGRKDLSDTMVAIIDFAEPLLPHLEDAKMLSILHKCLGGTSRWFIANKTHSWMLGDWEEEKETGIWYSNRGYLQQPKVTTYNNVYSPWQHLKEPDPIVVHTGSSKLMYWMNGEWSWKQWDKLTAPLLAASKPKKTDKTYEVFDENNDLISIIDIAGRIVWEKPEDESIPFDCPYCTNSISDIVLSSMGECPFCYEFVSSSAKTWDEGNGDMVCPNCGEQNYLIEPAYLDDVADTECVKCGALFDEGSDMIIGWASGLQKRGGGIR